jgi:guanine nucleotide-binding protein G(i) subunit alpha
MKIIHQNGFSKDELLSYRATIYKNLVDSAQALVLHMRKLQLDCQVPENRVRPSLLAPYDIAFTSWKANADKVVSYHVQSSPSFVLSHEVADAIHSLWHDPVIRPIADSPSDFYLMDSAS